MSLENLTIKQVRQGLRGKQFSALELAQSYLKKAKAQNKEIGAFLSFSQELALNQAKEVDQLVAQNKKLPLLAGVPGAVKDNILIKGLACTAGSKILENYQASYDATVIQRLKKEKAIILGKTNLDEFAMGSSTENSAFQKTKNPRDLSRVPGGSSGGSAAAVAAGQCVFALGSDTGGSIRQPASFCGAVGLKPTYGAVSRYGLIAFASSLDQIGPLAKTAGDCQIVFEAIKGYDQKDSTSIKISNDQCQMTNECQMTNIKIGIPKEYFACPVGPQSGSFGGKGLDRGVREAIEKTIKKLEERGAKIAEISLPHSKYALAVYYIIATSEASANLARFDGIRYGLSESKIKNQKSKSLLADYLTTREQGFGDEVKRRIMLGTFSLSAGYYDAYYLKAQKVRTLIKQDFAEAFKKVDFILGPVSPTTAFKFGEKTDDPLQMYLSDIYTVSINLAGLPALSLPVGESQGLPVGLQIIANYFEEAKIFTLAKSIENF